MTADPGTRATGLIGRAAFIAGDLLLAMFIVLCAPVVLIVVGLFVAAFVRLLVWIVTAVAFTG
jgi:hypothetical protein